MKLKTFAATAALVAAGFGLQGCLAAMATGAVVGVTGAAVKTTAKGVGMVAGAVIPGDGKKDEKKKR